MNVPAPTTDISFLYLFLFVSFSLFISVDFDSLSFHYVSHLIKCLYEYLKKPITWSKSYWWCVLQCFLTVFGFYYHFTILISYYFLVSFSFHIQQKVEGFSCLYSCPRLAMLFILFSSLSHFFLCIKHILFIHLSAWNKASKPWWWKWIANSGAERIKRGAGKRSVNSNFESLKFRCEAEGNGGWWRVMKVVMFTNTVANNFCFSIYV